MHPALKNCPVVVELPVVWGEMDAFGHVNNIVYFRYFESARIAYFERVDFVGYMNETGIGPILGSTQCKFRLPLTYPDRISIGARIAQIGADRVVMEYVVVSHKHQKIAAEGDGVVVSFDYREGKKAAMPDEIARRIKELEITSPEIVK